MALVITLAVIINRATITRGATKMKKLGKAVKSPAAERGQQAEGLLADIFEQAGWRVERPPKREFDMIVRSPNGVVYAVEVKAAVEGRADRLLPLFSQAVLQSQHGASKNAVLSRSSRLLRLAKGLQNRSLSLLNATLPKQRLALSISKGFVCFEDLISRDSMQRLLTSL